MGRVANVADASELAAALVAAFPARPLTRARLVEPSAGWEDYRDGDFLAEVEGKTWRELDHGFLDRHHSALRYAGAEGFGALLPAYLQRLLEARAFNEVPFVVAGELKRYGDPAMTAIFDARVAPLDGAQRAVVRRVLEVLMTREPMEAAMMAAFESWWRSAEA